MQYLPHAVSVALLSGVFIVLWLLHLRSVFKAQSRPPNLQGLTVASEYGWLYYRIRRAANHSELAALQAEAEELERNHKSHQDCAELFRELMKQVHQRDLWLAGNEIIIH